MEDQYVLPCPFCGGGAQFDRKYGSEVNGYADSVFYYCTKCLVQRGVSGEINSTGYADNSGLGLKALLAWNERV